MIICPAYKARIKRAVANEIADAKAKAGLMADSYTLRAGDVSRTEAKVAREAALNDLAGLGRGELREALKAVADTLATSDGTVHIRCYYRDQGDGSA